VTKRNRVNGLCLGVGDTPEPPVSVPGTAAAATGRRDRWYHPAPMDTTGSPFAAVLASVDMPGDTGAAVVPAGWGQGRATFGGLVAALAVEAARRRLPAPRPCRALVASFPGPVAPGEVELAVRPLRHGRAVSHLQIDVRQAGETACVVLASFGELRPSGLGVAPPPRPELPPPDELPPMIPEGGESVAPEFTRYVDYRLGFGARPYAGADVREIGGWCRFRNESRSPGEAEILGLLDAWPSPAVARMATPAPAASLTWSLELLPVEEAIPADGWWLYRAQLDASIGGYAHAAASLWSPGGRLAALSRQAVAVFG
jgi:acyl-CoA thioesterase